MLKIITIALALEGMKLYVCTILVMGIVQFPELNMYWEENDFFACPWIKKRWSRQNFYNYHRWFHGNVDFVEKTLNDTFFKNWTPEQHLAVDESIILFKGRFAGRHPLTRRGGGFFSR